MLARKGDLGLAKLGNRGTTNRHKLRFSYYVMVSEWAGVKKS